MRKIFFRLTILLCTGITIFISCKKETSCEGCRENNKPPIAIAGADQVITLPTDSVSLDGSSSNDPDGTISNWLWTKVSGPASFNINNAAASRTVVKNLVAGTYQFELKVTDDKSVSAKDTVQIIVDAVPTNHPPVANAGGDVRLLYCNPGQWVGNNSAILDGSGSADPDNNIVSYEWTRISGPQLPALSPISVPGHPEQIAVINLQPGTAMFELKVTDAKGLFSKDTAMVITSLNEPPIAEAGEIPAITLPTNTVTLNGSSSTDRDNNIRSYEWTKISGPTSSNILNRTAVQTQVTNLVTGNYQFELKVTDACGSISTDTVNVVVLGTANYNDLASYEIIITLPIDSVFIDDYFRDTEGTCVIYLSGPTTYTIQGQWIKHLLPGVYFFRRHWYNCGQPAEIIKVTVLDDPNEHNTITYKKMLWEYNYAWNYDGWFPHLFLSRPAWPGTINPSIEVYLQMDFVNNGEWFRVPSNMAGYDFSLDCRFYLNLCLSHFIIKVNPENSSWDGKVANLKIKIL